VYIAVYVCVCANYCNHALSLTQGQGGGQLEARSLNQVRLNIKIVVVEEEEQ